MTTISKAHQEFSERLEDPRVLTNPEEFLGPNYRAVLNFWMILDDLSEEQWRTIESRYWDFCNKPYYEWLKATAEADKASEETIGREIAYHAARTAWDVYIFAFLFATRELIGMHKLFEQNKPLTFFEMFLEVL